MFKRILSSLYLLLLNPVLYAQEFDTTTTINVPAKAYALAPADTSHLRVSLLTCGVGEELYASFGHTAVRVTDSVKSIDIVYNYGTFSFDDDFYPKFIRGKLLYYVSYYDFNSFMREYVAERRSVQEQVILLPGAYKQQIYDFLQNNALPENREYKYDFLFDNCATRIRDIFPRSLGKGFYFGQALPSGMRLTFRNIIDHYLRNKHWERFGIDMALGSPIDKPMTNEEIMFLPDYLRDGVGGATVNGKKVASEPQLLLPGSEEEPNPINGPFVLFSIVAILTVAGLTVPRLEALGKVMSSILLFITGLLGVFFLFMWLGTDHQSCKNNLSVLWALPTNLFLVFRKPRGAGKYALVAIVLLGISLLLHLLKIQQIPLLELGPLLLSLVFIYGTIYRKSKLKPTN